MNVKKRNSPRMYSISTSLAVGLCVISTFTACSGSGRILIIAPGHETTVQPSQLFQIAITQDDEHCRIRSDSTKFTIWKRHDGTLGEIISLDFTQPIDSDVPSENSGEITYTALPSTLSDGEYRLSVHAQFKGWSCAVRTDTDTVDFTICTPLTTWPDDGKACGTISDGCGGEITKQCDETLQCTKGNLTGFYVHRASSLSTNSEMCASTGQEKECYVAVQCGKKPAVKTCIKKDNTCVGVPIAQKVVTLQDFGPGLPKIPNNCSCNR